MKGHKRFRSGAWRLAVFAGVDPATGRKQYLFETVRSPNNRMGAKAADLRLAQLIAAVEEGRAPVARPLPKADVLTLRELAGALAEREPAAPGSAERAVDRLVTEDGQDPRGQLPGLHPSDPW